MATPTMRENVNGTRPGIDLKFKREIRIRIAGRVEGERRERQGWNERE